MAYDSAPPNSSRIAWVPQECELVRIINDAQIPTGLAALGYNGKPWNVSFPIIT